MLASGVIVKQLIANDFVSVWVDESRSMATLKRSAQRPQSIEEIAAAFDQATQAMNRLDRARLGVLIDLRDAPGRNDAEFERAMASRRSELMRGFQSCAILVKTPVGELQVARITREDGSDAKVFSDEAKALQWATPTAR